MKKRLLFFILCLNFVMGYSQDFDYIGSYYMMQQYNNAVMNQYMQQIFGMMGQISEQQKKQANATALIIPGTTSHSYGAFVILNYYTKNDIRIMYTDDEDDTYEINLSKCTSAGPYIIVPNVLRPGYTLKVYAKADGKYLQKENIPLLSSSLYSEFAQKAKNNLTFATSLLSPNGYNGGYNSGSGQSQGHTTVCRACHGTGKCGTCHGTGYYTGSYGTGTLKCPNCSESNGRICTVCHGTGKW